MVAMGRIARVRSRAQRGEQRAMGPIADRTRRAITETEGRRPNPLIKDSRNELCPRKFNVLVQHFAGRSPL